MATPDAHPAVTRRRLIPAYVALLCAGSLTVAALADRTAVGDKPLLFGLLIAFVLLVDGLRIDLFERGGTSPAGIPTLALAFLFGPLGPIASEACIAISRLVRGTAPIKAIYDFGSLSLAGAAVAGLLTVLPNDHNFVVVLGLAAASVVYYVANSIALCTIWWLDEGTPLLASWKERLAWLWPHYLACGLLAGAFVIAAHGIGEWAVAVFALPVVMIWVAEKQYLDRSRSSVSALRRQAAALEEANAELRSALSQNDDLIARMHQSYLSTITSLARTIEAKDPYTGGHTERVADFSLMLAHELDFEEDELRAVQVGAIVHDIGKIGIPDEILLKRGRLTDEEFAEMRRHPEISSYILAELELPTIVNAMVRHHHERYDGSGYPDRLAGEEIPLAARILTVADALDAMISNRPYREALPIERARREIQKNVGTQFCPAVVDALMRCLERDPLLLQPRPSVLMQPLAS